MGGSASDVGGAQIVTVRPQALVRAPGGIATTRCATVATSSVTRGWRVRVVAAPTVTVLR